MNRYKQVILTVCLMCASSVASIIMARLYYVPYGARLYSRAKSDLEGLVATIEDGGIEYDSSRHTYPVPPSLAASGIRYVRAEQGCIMMYLETLPPDASHILVYSRDGYSGIPCMCGANGENQVVCMHYLDHKWFLVYRS